VLPVDEELICANHERGFPMISSGLCFFDGM